MIDWKRFFLRSGTRDKAPKIYLTESEADKLLSRLQTTLDDRFHSASHEERVNRAYSFGYLGKSLGLVKVKQDFDAMFVYAEFSIFDNFDMEHCFPVLRNVLGVKSLHGVITQEHLDIHAEASQSFYRDGGKDRNNRVHSKEWTQLCALVLRDRLDQANEILELMHERKVYSAQSLSDLLDARAELSSPLASGAL